MDHNPKVKKLAQLTALFALSVLLGTAAVFLSHAMGVSPVLSMFIGGGIGLMAFTVPLLCLIERENRRRFGVHAPLLPALPPAGAAATIPAAIQRAGAVEYQERRD